MWENAREPNTKFTSSWIDALQLDLYVTVNENLEVYDDGDDNDNNDDNDVGNTLVKYTIEIWT